ncbi:MAG: hypothetical protein AB1540_08035, partial [Bdellovibrionota bacterium]
THRGTMSVQSTILLNAIQRLATPPSDELVYRLATSLKSPAEAFELTARLHESFPEVVEKPPLLDSIGKTFFFWQRARTQKELQKRYDFKNLSPEESRGLLPATTESESQ